MARNLELPAGLTQEMMESIAAFFTAQQDQLNQAPRPRGLLTANQIRGVNPRYKYTFKEYPKALTPPPIQVRDAKHERDLRVQWQKPLPWNPNDPDGKELINDYYASQEYPREVNPPQIVVRSPEEEHAVIAGWKAEGRIKPGDVMASTGYPKWKFHAEKGASFVKTREDEQELGRGWYDTPLEAQKSAAASVGMDLGPKRRLTPEEEKEDLLARATKVGVEANSQWGLPRLRREVEEAEVRAAKKAA